MLARPETLFDAGVAQGLTLSWAPSSSLNVRARVEHVAPIGDTFQRNTAVGVGATWEPEEQDRVLDGDIEYARSANDRDTWYGSAAVGRRWDDVTLLLRSRKAIADGAGDSRTRNRTRLGWAHRPDTDDALNTFAWYEYEHDDQNDTRVNRHIWSLGGERKPNGVLRLRGRLAGQYYSYTGFDLDEDTVTLLAQAGADRDIGKRWNVAANLTGLTDGGWENQYYGIGGEVNFAAAKNALVGVGYNHTRLKEERIRRLYRAGWYVRLRIKFDQDVWDIFEDEPQ